MALNKKSIDILNDELDSYDNIIDIIKLIKKVNNFSKKRFVFLCITIVFSILLSIALLKFNTFGSILDFLTDTSLVVSTGLIGLIIAGYSIVMSSLSNDSLYCLLLQKSDAESTNMYTTMILRCTEPLLWFSLLLILSIFLKIFYLIKDLFYINFIILKIFILALLILVMIISVISLVYFIINMYNVLVSNARFELLKRYAKATNTSIDDLIKNFEKILNETNDS